MEEAIKLLIVDDEVPFLTALRERLELRDFEVTTASDGNEALALCAQQKFDVALVDLKMPGLDGREVLMRLNEAGADLEVIILTGHGSLSSAVDCTKLGAFAYLPKPYELEKLLVTLRDAYAQRVARRFEARQEAERRRLAELLEAAQGESPLGMLRRMRKLDRGDAGEDS